MVADPHPDLGGGADILSSLVTHMQVPKHFTKAAVVTKRVVPCFFDTNAS